MNILTIAAKFVRRDMRAGELWLFILSLILALSCMSSIQLFTDRIERAMKTQTASLIGGDVVLSSHQKIDKNIIEKAHHFDLSMSQTTSFFSMVSSKDKLVLADIKAVAAPYPLRGELKIATSQFTPGEFTKTLPQPGEIWVQGRLMQQLGLQLEDNIKIGKVKLSVKNILAYEPDRAGSWFAIAPRILMNQEDIARSEIIQAGSRIEYRLLLTGEENDLRDFSRLIKSSLKPGQELIDAKKDRPNLATVIDKTHDFLNLSGVVAVILAGISIALSTQKYCQRHQNTVALMRCFGTSLPKIISIFMVGLLLLCCLGIIIGISCGFLFQPVLEILFSGLINLQLPSVNMMASLPAVYIGLLLVIGFSLPQLIRLKYISSRELLRQSQKKLPAQNILVYTSAFFSVAAILFWQTQDIKLLAFLILAMSFSVSVMYLFANLLIVFLNKIQLHFISAWRIGLLNVVRHRANSVLQITAFGMIFLIILLLMSIYTDLTSKWQNDLPKNTPNYFVINISPEKSHQLTEFLSDNKIYSEPLYPIIRGRLTTLEGKPIKQSLTVAQQSDNSLYRDLNLTYRKRTVAGNSVVEGQWWPEENKEALVSVEEGVANRLGLKLGQQIGLNISGEEVSAKIVNFRRVSWTSFKPNFFMIFSPGLLDKFPQTYMTSFSLPASQTALLILLNKQFPDITIIDIADIITMLQTIITQMTLAMTYLLFFLLAIGLLVLITGVMANIKQRSHESAIMRAYGASSWQLRKILMAEFVSLGALAGFSAGITVIFSRWILSFWLVDFPIHFNFWLIGLTPIVSSLVIAVTGYLASLPVLRSSPMLLLKTF